MKMAKASEADLEMASELARMLECFERYRCFPPVDDDTENERFDRDNAEHCRRAMELILDKLQEGSLFRVTFGMLVLLDPKNKAVDPDKDYIDHHPETLRAREMHDELVAALKRIAGYRLSQFSGPNDMSLACVQAAEDALAKLEAR